MAIIPDVADLQRANPDLREQVGPAPQLGAPLQFQNMAEGGSKLIEEMYQRQVNNEVAKAKTQLQLAKIEQDEAYDQDQDVDTIEDRWHGEMMDHLGKAATNITDGQVRDRFVMEGQVTVEQGRANIRQFAFKKKADQEIAYAENSTDQLIKSAVSETGDIPGAFDAIESTWESAAEQGYVSNEQAQENIRQTKFKIAESKIQTMAPQDQLEALKSDWAAELPLDVRVALERQAKELLKIGTAQTAAFEARAAGLSEAEAATAFYEYFKGQPEVLLEAQRQYSILKNNDKQSVAEISSELYNRYDVDIRAGEVTTAMIKARAPADWEAMTPAIRTNLETLENNRLNRPVVYSDRRVLSGLMERFKVQDMAGAKQFFYENSASLNPSDYEDWLGKVTSERPGGLFDVQKQVEDLTLGMGKKRKANIYNSITKYYLRYQEENDGQEPSDRDVNDYIHRSILNYSTGWFGSSLPSEMDPGDRLDAYQDLEIEEREDFLDFFEVDEQRAIIFEHYQGKHPVEFEQTLQYFRNKNIPVDKIDRRQFEFMLQTRVIAGGG